MKRHLLFATIFLYAAICTAAYTIRGRVTTDDTTKGVPHAELRIYGFDARVTDERGFFTVPVSKEKLDEYKIRGGIDLTIGITTSDSMVLLDPFNGRIRLSCAPGTQEPFRIRVVKKGSLLLTRSEDVLYSILQKRIEAALMANKQQLEKRDVLAEEAQRLGIRKSELTKAVEEYKNRRCATDDLLRCALAALDERQPDTALSRLSQIRLRHETTLAEATKAKKELPLVYFNMGLAWFEKVIYDSARIYFTLADSMQPGNAQWLNWLGRTLHETGKYAEAIAVYGNALAIDTVVFGNNHPNVAIRYNNLGSAWKAKGNYDRAIEFYSRALAIDTVVYGNKHPDVAIDYNNLGGVWDSKGNYDRAIEFYSRALAIDTVVYGNKHPDVAIRYNNLGEAWRAKGKYDRAIEFYSRALAIDTVAYGNKHPQVAIRYNNLGLAWRAKGNNAKAREYLNNAIECAKPFWPENHPSMQTFRKNLAAISEDK